MDDTLIDGAQLKAARSLTQAQVDLAWGDTETKLPAGVFRPENKQWLPAVADSEAKKSRTA